MFLVSALQIGRNPAQVMPVIFAADSSDLGFQYLLLPKEPARTKRMTDDPHKSVKFTRCAQRECQDSEDCGNLRTYPG